MPTKTVKKVTRVSEDLSKWLENEANKSGVSQSALIALIIQKHKRSLESE